jgi:hypothetical protein
VAADSSVPASRIALAFGATLGRALELRALERRAIAPKSLLRIILNGSW